MEEKVECPECGGSTYLSEGVYKERLVEIRICSKCDWNSKKGGKR